MKGTKIRQDEKLARELKSISLCPGHRTFQTSVSVPTFPGVTSIVPSHVKTCTGDTDEQKEHLY